MLAIIGASVAVAAGGRIVSSYCTSPSGCLPSVVERNFPALNAFSTTSYYLGADGDIRTCNERYAACNWTSPVRVDDFNEKTQMSTGALAQPLLFSNSGDMVRAFRALASRGVGRAAAFLANKAGQHGYSRLQLDLEPSCWAKNASMCEWPTAADARAYVAFVNATADALRAAAGATVSVAVGSWPDAQCKPGQYDNCTAAGEAYAAACSAGEWPVDACNCCAYASGFYDVGGLCASRAATIVNMDTYQTSPANLSAFREALGWYAQHGCTPERLAAGLLANEAANASEARALVQAAAEAGVWELDVWVNLWAKPKRLRAWRTAFEAFAAPPPPSPPTPPPAPPTVPPPPAEPFWDSWLHWLEHLLKTHPAEGVAVAAAPCVALALLLLICCVPAVRRRLGACARRCCCMAETVDDVVDRMSHNVLLTGSNAVRLLDDPTIDGWMTQRAGGRAMSPSASMSASRVNNDNVHVDFVAASPTGTATSTPRGAGAASPIDWDR